MTEAIFGLVGVLLGSGISWFQSDWTNRRATKKNARYLAIRIVCILDKFIEDCTAVVKDDGLFEGQRDSEGCLQPQVKTPAPPDYPDDVDWKSIDHELMYRILSLPSEIADGDRLISGTWDIASPPDYSEWFDERKFYYCHFGLTAYKLSSDLIKEYGIKMKTYNNWNPAAYLKQELEKVVSSRNLRIDEYKEIMKRLL